MNGKISDVPQPWLMGSFVVLTVLSMSHLPTATGWMPLSRPSFVKQQNIPSKFGAVAFGLSEVYGAVPSKISPIILHATEPSDDEAEYEEYEEWEEIEDVDVDEDEDTDDMEEEEEDDEEIDDDDDDDDDYDYDDDDYEYEDDEEDEDDDDDDVDEIENIDEIIDEEEMMEAKSLKEDVEGYDDEVEMVEEKEAVEEVKAVEESLEGTSSSGGSWDDEDEGDFPLEDDPNDPHYQKQKELMELAVAESDRVGRDRNFDATSFMMNEMTEEMMEQMDQMPFIQEARERAKNIEISETDLEGVDLEEELAQTSDLLDDEYPRHEEGEENFLANNIGLTDDLMEEADRTWKRMRETLAEEPWDRVGTRAELGFEGLSNETLEELAAAWEVTDRRAPYNYTKWFLYDLDFNVTNLVLAAVKHNREAPIFFSHWYPQLTTYSRYEDARERNFDFTYDDVEKADLAELERYYKGMGYDEIPEKAPAETGMIEFEYLDEEEIKMAAFEEWIKDVYNPEWDRKDFDDDDITDEDNIFSTAFVPRKHPELPTPARVQKQIEIHLQGAGVDVDDDEIDYEEIYKDMEPEEIEHIENLKEYRDYIQDNFYTAVDKDTEYNEEFRGKLVVACSGEDSDLEIAEKITLAIGKAYGEKVYVETQVIGAARDEDNVFEVWLESYNIDLLHSKRRATSNTADWDGPAECDDSQVDYLVETVGFLISDDARYSYSYTVDGVVE